MGTRSKGFSLPEIMIVVAIIGLLAAFAVPSYQRYVLKAKQAEAKANLSSLYQAMQSFSLEYVNYTTRFDAIGFRPEGSLNYVVGFYADTRPPGAFLFPSTSTCIITRDVAGAGTPACSYPVTWTNAGPALQAGPFPAYAVAGANSFVAAAIGNINGVTIDSWSIDTTNTLTSSGATGL